MLSVQEIIARLGLEPLTIEGGFFRETYRSRLAIPAAALPTEYRGERSVSTAIYYLLTPETCSAIHRVRSDEVFHFYAGDPVEILQLRPDGTARIVIIGSDLAEGHVPQVVVPAGVWQGCRLAQRGDAATREGVSPRFRHRNNAAIRSSTKTGTDPKENGDRPRCGWVLMGCTVAPGFDDADFVAGDRAALIAEYPKFAELITALTPP